MMTRMVRSCGVAVALALGLFFASEGRAEITAQTRVNIAWQIALEESNFSAGIIDGAWGRKGKIAIEEYAKRFYPELKSPYDNKVLTSLKVDVENAVVKYTIDSDDMEQVGGPLPDNWNEKAKLDKLKYETLADALAERFHCTQSLLASLNPGVKFETLKSGDAIMVPNIRPFPDGWKWKTPTNVAASGEVRVNLSEKTIRVYDKDGNQLALFHCSVAKDKAKLPARDVTVRDVAVDPEYSFDPVNWPEVNNVTRKLRISPGPRNPVGLMWVALDLPGYGIHGNPKPELIGKTGSHGCFRLTNWDAIRFASFVRRGMTVKMINPETQQ